MEKTLNSDDLVDMGEQHHRAGQLQEAESYYRKALEVDPGHPGALYYLANIAYEDDRLQFATQLTEELLRGEPTDAEAWHLLGMVALKEESISRAVECFQTALTSQPAFSQAHYSLGSAFGKLNNLDEAFASFQRTVNLTPAFAEAHLAMGNISRSRNNPDAAIASYKKAIEANPGIEMGHLCIGQVLLSQGKLEEAISVYHQALVHIPGSAKLHSDLGNAQALKGRIDDALVNIERAITLDSNLIEPYNNLGNLLVGQGKFNEGIETLKKAVSLNPQDARLKLNLVGAFEQGGRLADAIPFIRDAIALDPDNASAHSFLLLALQYLPDYPRENVFHDHVEFGDRFEAALRKNWRLHPQPDNVQSRLRVGFVSGDLRGHPVGYFLEGILGELHRRDEIDIFVYATATDVDALTDRLRATTHFWLPVHDLSDDDFAQHIRDDRVDILVDLSGHTANNRLLVFARKPAPIQVTWLGYWETTGLRAIDYILCDRYTVRDDESEYYVEHPWRLPHTRLCFTTPGESIAVAPLPAIAAGHVTFGCLNNLMKMNDRVVAVWARILKRVPNARLLLKSTPLFDAAVRKDVVTRFAAHGVAADKLLLEPAAPRLDYLGAYSRVDIALDPFPFPGGTTSVEGIWMGVPMITMRGERIISRQGESILHNIGLRDWIAADEDDYVELAVRHAGDLAGLSTLRSQLRAKLESSPLCNTKLFAQNLEEAFKTMWKKYRESFTGEAH